MDKTTATVPRFSQKMRTMKHSGTKINTHTKFAQKDLRSLSAAQKTLLNGSSIIAPTPKTCSVHQKHKLNFTPPPASTATVMCK
jgi:hypothetical protein